MQIDDHVARRLRTRRRLVGMTLYQVAAATGFSYQNVQKYENGIIRLSAANLWVLAHALGVEPGYFFEGLEPAAERPSRPLAPTSAERDLAWT